MGGNILCLLKVLNAELKYNLAISVLDMYPKINKNRYSKISLYRNIHSSTTHSGRKVETT